VNPNPTKARILIVDDDPAIRNLLHSILCDGYTCTTAESAEEALANLENETFDLVISDINMGGMSGIELVAKVTASTPDTVVMVISGNLDLDSPIEAIRSGAFDYIKKPFDIDQVEMGVDRAIRHAALLVSKRKHEEHLEQLVAERTEKLNYLAYHDYLTGIPNRFFFEERLAKALLSHTENDHLAVLFVSLDNFRELRDTFGHRSGDQLLKDVSGRLKALTPDGEIAARFAGDEFALLVSEKNTDDLRTFAEGIVGSFAAPFIVNEKEAYVSVSIGISLSSVDGGDGMELLKNAGAALSHARKQGGNDYQFYTSDINAKVLKRLEFENILRGAVERNELELHYQPKIDINTRTMIGMEALVRWNHPELGLIPPFDFIPVAEETGLIVPMGEWILRSACAQSKLWHDMGFPLHLAVNLSVRQFQQDDLVETIRAIIADTGFDPEFLNLEITESAIMVNIDVAVAVLQELRLMGIKISIDDFGTGHSSLGYLKHLPIDVLKIDKSFVNDVTTNPDDAALVTSVITLAHNLRLRIVAEGVETEEQLNFLRLLRCDEWQGYLFSKPLTVEAFEVLLTADR
jgi:diguanylate cyclase (GGDEF)-like protein